MKDIVLKEDRSEVYEIGYLLISSVPAEKVADIVTTLKDTLSKKGAEFIGEEAPELITLAYPMVKKIGVSNQTFDKGYFGWVKFEIKAKEIEGIKKSFEENASMLRMLLINTIKENTYLGKKSHAPTVEVNPEALVTSAVDPLAPEAAAPVATAEEMDKSIDAMVKEV